MKEPTVAIILDAALHLDRTKFIGWLSEYGFIAQPISTKCAFVGKTCVVKFDVTTSLTKESPTYYEYMNRRRVQKWKRRWFARTLGWANGVLVQERAMATHSPCRTGPCCVEAEHLARRLRILDWYNHGRRADGSIVFFDFDSFGSGWWNYHKAKRGTRNGH